MNIAEEEIRKAKVEHNHEGKRKMENKNIYQISIYKG